jgi:tetratricopeptide (TPR) repeat protein
MHKGASADAKRCIEEQLKASEPYCQRALRLADTLSLDELVSTLYALGSLQMREKKYDEALRTFDKAIKENANDPRGYVGRGEVFFQMENKAAAQTEFQRAIKTNPNSAATYVARGNAYQAAGNLEAAVRDYSTAIDADPNFAFAYANRARAYMLQRKPDLSMKDDLTFQRLMGWTPR